MKKKICFILLFFSISFSSFAQIRSNVVLFTEEGERFWVVLNGERQFDQAQTNVKINSLNAPMYRMKIIFENSTIPEMDKNLYVEENMETTYNIKRNNKGEFVLRYMTSVPVQQSMNQPLPGQLQMVFGSPVFTPPPTPVQQVPVNPNNGGDQMNVNINIGGIGVGMNVNTGVNNVPVPSPPVQNNNYGYGVPVTPPPPPVFVAGYSGPIGCPMPMSSSDFSQAKKSISSKSFDQTMLETAKTILSRNCMTVAQVEELVDVFSFENSKLEIAKYAYNSTYDLGNFYRVADHLTFSSSQEDLMEFINSK